MVHDSVSSSLSFNEDLSKILQWAYQWKLLFNPDASKQTHKIVFSCKRNSSNHSDIYYNNMPLKRKNTQEHIGLYLDAQLDFSVYDPQGSKLLNTLRLGFMHWCKHMFPHNFADTVNPLCSCALETESKNYLFSTLPELCIISHYPNEWIE